MSDEVGSYVPPHSSEAEMSVLGAMLLEQEVVGELSSMLDPEDFYVPKHAQIYEAVLGLDAENVAVDLVTVCDALERAGKLEEFGGRAMLVSLLEVLPSAANATHYARIVREKSVLRRIAKAGDVMRVEALTSESPALEVLDRAESSVFEIGEREGAAGTVSVGQVLEQTFARLEELTENKGALTGVDTGYFRFNDKTGGPAARRPHRAGGAPFDGKDHLRVERRAERLPQRRIAHPLLQSRDGFGADRAEPPVRDGPRQRQPRAFGQHLGARLDQS